MKYFVIDAFADTLFKGNPAGVCILEKALPDEVLQNIAFENNLAETAFIMKKEEKYYLRWFTPEVEIDLCGHATLASAYVLMNEIDPSICEVAFETQSGTLVVQRTADIFTMNFPSRPPIPVETPYLLEEALGCKILETHKSRDFLVLLENESAVRTPKPNIPMIMKICSGQAFAMIVTVP